MKRYIAAFGLFALAGCGSAASSPAPEPAPEVPELGARSVGEEPDVCDGQCKALGDIDYYSSLVVMDPEILQHFKLRRVLEHLIQKSGAYNDPDSLWKQWWLSQGKRHGGFPSHWPFCDDPNPFPNQARDFGMQCPRAEEQLANYSLDEHYPIALVNRFDLAPLDGANCGEYRIVYGQEHGAGPGGENLIIFEGQLPNPSPDCGLAGCLPVVEFWQSLTTEKDVGKRAHHLNDFYFEGICGFEPVLLPEHLGLNCKGGGGGYGEGCGQIRTNQFVEEPWNLREYRLDMECWEPGCELLVVQQPVAQNPHPDLWQSGDPDHGALHSSILAQLHTNLPMPDGINLIAADTDPRLNASESVIDWWSFYDADSNFENDIDNEISNLPGSPQANANDIEERVLTQSCAGCHELSNGAALGETGGGASLHWPYSLKFKHIDHGQISPAMQQEFLPWRAEVMAKFLDTTCGHECFGEKVLDKEVVVVEVKDKDGDRFVRSVKFSLISKEEALEKHGGEIPFDTLSGSRTH